jgi:hypothetical protein
MSKDSKPSRLEQMGVPTATVERLRDLAEAFYDAKEGRLITEALEMFIETTLRNEAEVRKRFEEARQKRRAGNIQNIHALSGGKDSGA